MQDRTILYPELIPELLKEAGFTKSSTAQQIVEYCDKIAPNYGKHIQLPE